MRQLANYKIEGLMHMRILLVDQHVEGDDQSALQWVLRADVERTALLEDEQRLLACQHGNADVSSLPKDLQVLPVMHYELVYCIFACALGKRRLVSKSTYSTANIIPPTHRVVLAHQQYQY